MYCCGMFFVKLGLLNLDIFLGILDPKMSFLLQTNAEKSWQLASYMYSQPLLHKKIFFFCKARNPHA